MKILFLVKKFQNSYGVSTGLQNSCKFLANAINSTKHVEAKVSQVIDSNSIDREVHNYKPDYCILEAFWVTPEKLEENLKLHPKTLFVIRNHSQIAFMAEEGQIFKWIIGYKRLIHKYHNLQLGSNNLQNVDDLTNSTYVRWHYLPNVYHPDQPRHRKEYTNQRSHKGKFIDISSFGAIRPLKNQLKQAVAAIEFADSIDKSLRFHVNSGRIETRGEQVLKNLRSLFDCSKRHDLVEHPWMDYHQFIKWINWMDISLQLSFTETFNIVTADAVWHETPVVVSTDVDWIPSIYQADPNDTDDIVSKMNRAWKFPSVAAKLNYNNLKAYNKKSLATWLKYLQENKLGHK